MLKKFANFFRKNSSLEKEEETAEILWESQSRKIDAAVPRRRALWSQQKNGKTNIKKDLRPRETEPDEDKHPRRYLKIFAFNQSLHVLFERNRQFFVKSLDDNGPFKEEKKIVIVNSFGYDVFLESFSNVNIGQINDKLVLNYQRDTENDRVTAFANSLSDLIFQENCTTKTIKYKLIFAQKNTYQGKYTAYTGENFIYFATANSLKSWEIQKEYILTPRQKFFDHNGLKMIEAINLKEGIFLLYESSFVQDGRFYLQIGGALFEEKNPNKLIWRSDRHIWEQSFPLKEIKESHPIGASWKNKNIFVYYVVNGELMTVDFTIPNFHAEKNRRVIIERHKKNPIMVPNPKNKWESKAVFNAAAIHAEGKFHLIYRAIGEDNVSALGYACSEDGFDFDMRLGFPVYVPREKFEGVHGKKYVPLCTDKAVYESGGGCCGGCEDPRITKVDDVIYMTYVAYNGHDVPGVAITSIKYEDFINHRWNWNKTRLISKPGQIQKNWVLFPEKINGKFAIIHGLSPKVHIEYIDSFEDFDGENYINSLPSAHGKGYQDPDRQNHWDNIVRGTGAPPIRTKYGWLVFYHAMDKNDPNRYKIGAMILDHHNPEKILYRSRVPILEPDEHYENEGMKAGVVYVCGAVIKDDMLHIYYGGADMVMCVASSKLDDFLEKLVGDKRTIMEKINI
ncbi:MAG: glycosidase ph1107-related protein [uncultured bacterium]|nr:MAG: glycosidase ph1107-related protein [uncultured bacterium]